ncbi:cation-binding protein [Vibrio sp. UCD-FRSSP16_10]|uniref:hemerythrin domain-containing protein n=1 Tax=unclassified Vibrio TaxID=2614977 RepID=UPI0007FED6FD|nr:MULTISPECIES: hemerythrin domain-containing protein [unclassified Vibrio]OBT07314.1 cation-binding protein [Vibrio sp. UCD-FRSSP16_30]OBT12793.1 cation-binding protein [Vibrio sp. UCD-FRSSP16_10]
MMIERIQREHAYMIRLLGILKAKLVQVQAEEPVNYTLLKEIVDYLCVHSERTHHPKEDLIYQYFVSKYGEQSDVSDLAAEHVALSKTTHEFLDIVDMILQDAVVPTDVFAEQLESFIHNQKQHLYLEEHKILPLINQTLTTSDWQYLESQWGAQEEDPVFGETIADKYKQLAERVKQIDKELI